MIKLELNESKLTYRIIKISGQKWLWDILVLWTLGLLDLFPPPLLPDTSSYLLLSLPLTLLLTRQVSVRKLCPANFFLNCLLRQVFPQCSSYHNFNFSSIIWNLYTGRAVQNSSYIINNHLKFVVTGTLWLLSWSWYYCLNLYSQKTN